MTRCRALISVVAVTAAVALAACGVPMDSAPRAITRTTVSENDQQDQTPTTSGSPTAQSVSVFFLRGERLEEVRYPVDGDPSLAEALGYVLAGPPETEPALSSAIPPDIQLLNVRVSDRVARIDLSSEIGDISGQPQKQAFAQIVFTALGFSGITSVRFRVEGKAIAAPTDNGNLEEITASDYDPPLNPR